MHRLRRVPHKGLKLLLLRVWCRSHDCCLNFNRFNISGRIRWGNQEPGDMLRRIPDLFLRCLNLFEGCGTLSRSGRYVMLRITLLIINVIMRHGDPLSRTSLQSRPFRLSILKATVYYIHYLPLSISHYVSCSPTETVKKNPLATLAAKRRLGNSM